MTSYPFPEIELEDECGPELQFSDSCPILESISAPVMLPKLSNVFEPALNPIIPEHESIISPNHIHSVDENQDSIPLHPFELAQNFENPLIFCVTPRSRGYGDITAMYIRRSETPHVYTLSISTGKNQSIEAQW